MSLDLENFEEVKIRGEEFYRTLDNVSCPYFDGNVSFNAQFRIGELIKTQNIKILNSWVSSQNELALFCWCDNINLWHIIFQFSKTR